MIMISMSEQVCLLQKRGIGTEAKWISHKGMLNYLSCQKGAYHPSSKNLGV
jgi:hypothetical protein